MSRVRLSVLTIALAVFAASGVVVTTASAGHPQQFPTEVALLPNHFRTIDNVAVANLGGNPLLFLEGCFGHPAVGTLFGYQDATAAVVDKVPSAGQQPTSVYSYGGGLTVPNFPVFTSDGTMSPYTAGALPSPVPFIEYPSGNFALGIAIDPKAFTGLVFTTNAIAINVKDPTGNALAGSPIITLNGELVQVTVTKQPTLTPPRFNQPLQWACDKMNTALQAVRDSISIFRFARTIEAALKARQGSQSKKVNWEKQAAAALSNLLDVESDFESDDYQSGVQTAIPETLKDFKAYDVAGKALAARFVSPASKKKFLKAERQALAKGRAALAALQAAVTIA